MTTPIPPTTPVPRTALPTSSDPLAILIDHNTWATREILEDCRRLSQSQFHQAFPMGLGSLHNTLTHIIGAMLRWADRVSGPPTPLRPSIERPQASAPGDAPTVVSGMPARSVEELVALLNQADADLRAATALSRDRGLGSVIQMQFGDKTYHFTRAAALVHALSHGTHHRAQCLNMMRHLNIAGLSDNLPEIDVVDWQATCETGESAPRRR